MQDRIMYVELKSGYADNGPAWIGKVKFSKSGQTLYFNNKGFGKISGFSANYIDLETREEYWISGVKKNSQDRHWAGSGKIQIDRKVIDEYLKITGEKALDSQKFMVVDILDLYPIERINQLENS